VADRLEHHDRPAGDDEFQRDGKVRRGNGPAFDLPGQLEGDGDVTDTGGHLSGAEHGSRFDLPSGFRRFGAVRGVGVAFRVFRVQEPFEVHPLGVLVGGRCLIGRRRFLRAARQGGHHADRGQGVDEAGVAARDQGHASTFLLGARDGSSRARTGLPGRARAGRMRANLPT
jgi:hypothetical protein